MIALIICGGIVILAAIAVVVYYRRTNKSIKYYVGNKAAMAKFDVQAYFKQYFLEQNLHKVTGETYKKYHFDIIYSNSKQEFSERYTLTHDELVGSIRAAQVQAAQIRAVVHGMAMEEVDRLDEAAFEKLVCDMLTANPRYQAARLTHATEDFGIDVFAHEIASGKQLGFQAKRSSHPLGIKAVQEALSGRELFRLDKALIITNSTFTAQARRFAESLDIELLDRSDLASWLIEYAKH